jgi:hypothetical protein
VIYAVDIAILNKQRKTSIINVFSTSIKNKSVKLMPGLCRMYFFYLRTSIINCINLIENKKTCYLKWKNIFQFHLKRAHSDQKTSQILVIRYYSEFTSTSTWLLHSWILDDINFKEYQNVSCSTHVYCLYYLKRSISPVQYRSLPIWKVTHSYHAKN